MNEQDPNFKEPVVPDPPGNFPEDVIVVGVGASAGGLEALTELLEHLPSQLNMAFVVIQHLDPRHESSLPELLSGKTRMRVVPVQQDVQLERNHVYVISPNSVLRVRAGRLLLETRPTDSFKPIDIFFHSLAEEFRERAIGIVLSGTATDGTFGLKHIKAEGASHSRRTRVPNARGRSEAAGVEGIGSIAQAGSGYICRLGAVSTLRRKLRRLIISKEKILQRN